MGDVLLRGGYEYGKYVDSFVYLFSPHLISPSLQSLDVVSNFWKTSLLRGKGSATRSARLNNYGRIKKWAYLLCTQC